MIKFYKNSFAEKWILSVPPLNVSEHEELLKADIVTVEEPDEYWPLAITVGRAEKAFEKSIVAVEPITS